MNLSRKTKLIAASGIALLTFAGCGADAEAEPSAGPEGDADVNIGYVVWDEVLAPTFLWKHLLEEEGYTVELTQ